jgi:hypothetical protein
MPAPKLPSIPKGRKARRLLFLIVTVGLVAACFRNFLRSAGGCGDWPGDPHDGQARDVGRSVPDSCSAAQDLEAPYGELCETRPRSERQPWNTRKKVISLSLFMPYDRRGQPVPRPWLDGLEANVRLASLYYPEWIVRVYVLNLSEEQIEQVIAIDDKSLEVVVCPEGSALTFPVNTPKPKFTQYRSANSRYLAVDDPKVEYAMFRDLDSRPSIRELLAVNEWISSGMAVHAMHDHKAHNPPLMGGMWGAKRGAMNMTSAIMRALHAYPNVSINGIGGDDQGFLAEFIWPAVKDSAINHEIDPDRCRQHGAKVCRKFPMAEGHVNSAFVGQRIKGTQRRPNPGSGSHYQCSVACRPSQEDWYTDLSTSNL